MPLSHCLGAYIRLLFAALLTCVLAPAMAEAPSTDGKMIVAPYQLPPLPYAFDALEPAIDAETMRVHHGKHHGAFVNNLNQLAGEHAVLRAGPVESLLAEISKHPPAIRNNLGGHYNHALFWTLLAPAGKGGEVSEDLRAALIADFGSFEQFQAQFADAGAKRFGSGWVWLVVTDQGKLAITSTANQDNPLMDVAELRGTPILALDVWEHAYYLKYRNLRADYIKAWWGIVHWHEVNRRYQKLVAGRSH